MEFNEKLKELRRKRGVTQEELAESLYVSRTAISKWESGRGYPGLDSIKAISEYFSVTIDELLSTGELLSIAGNERKRTRERTRDLIFGLADILSILLLFLPIFAKRSGGAVESVSLISGALGGYMNPLYIVITVLCAMLGVSTLAMQEVRNSVWLMLKCKVSFTLNAVLMLIFVLGLQAYAAVFAFSILSLKAVVFIDKQ